MNQPLSCFLINTQQHNLLKDYSPMKEFITIIRWDKNFDLLSPINLIPSEFLEKGKPI